MMDCNTKTVGRLLALGLSALLIFEVVLSMSKLRGDRTAVSVRKYYENIRFMPSVSICFKKEMSEKFLFEEDNSTLAELELNFTR